MSRHEFPRRDFFKQAAGIGLLACGCGSSNLFAQYSLESFCGFSLDGGWGDNPANFVSKNAKYITGTANGLAHPSGIPRVVYEIERILRTQLGLKIYLAEQENNAYAKKNADGSKLIVIDVGFLQKLNRMANTQWAAISVIAHELGHHIDDFSGGPHGELRADYWSGLVLQRLGSSEQAAVSCMQKYGSEQDSNSHPSKYKRIAAIQKGWTDAKNGTIDFSQCRGCKGTVS